MRTRGLAVPFLLVSLVAHGARAADFYVDSSAAAGGDGSSGKPFTTINAALAGLSRGDTVWIATGTYDEVVDIAKLPGTSGTTTLRAMAGATPIIDGTSGSASAGFVIQSSVPDTTLQGLTIQNAEPGALGVQFYYADGGKVIDCITHDMPGNAITFYYSNQGTVSGCTLQGNIGGRKTTGTVVEHNEVYGSSNEGIGLYDGSTECTIAHNVVHDNHSVNIYLDSISHSLIDGNLVYETTAGNDLEGIEFSDEFYMDLAAPVNSYNVVTNNVIVGHDIGIAFWLSGLWPTTALNDQSGLRYDVIANNTLVNNTGGIKWDASPATVGTTIENNIIAAAAGTSPNYLLQANAANGITIDHNLWFAPDLAQPFLWVNDQTDHAGFVTAAQQGGGDVLADPLFSVGSTWSAPPAANLALTKGSSAIGVGVTLTSVTEDYLGATRPAGKYDLGAFQYGASPAEDAGATKATGDASTSRDAGASREDAGSGSHAGGPDAGSRPADGGDDVTTTPSKGSSGCACASALGTPQVSAGWLAIVAGSVGLRRRRRRA